MSDHATAVPLTDVDARPLAGHVIQALAITLSLAPVLAVAIWSVLWAL